LVASVAQLVEQLTLNQLVQGSNPCRGTILFMAWIYVLRGTSGRHYIGSTADLERRIQQHRNGQTHSTRRLGGDLKLAAFLEVATLNEARRLEREMKRKKNPQLALHLLQQRGGNVAG
jgi:predicted GIY-YIG superfamily endonuclease